MIACLDVHYGDEVAVAAAVVFADWQSRVAAAEYVATAAVVGAYEPGRFYARELLPLHAVTGKIAEPIDVFIVDAYCHLSADHAPGLGDYLYKSLLRPASVVGVAKSRYRDTKHAVELLRGGSVRPLFVTSIGLDYRLAAQHVAEMAGDHRIPDLIKAADRLSRSLPKDG